MIKVAFCDDEPVILEQITDLLEKYKEQRCRDMEYAAFRWSCWRRWRTACTRTCCCWM